MLYGIPYDSPAAFPVVVLVVYLFLAFIRILSRNAKRISGTETTTELFPNISSADDHNIEQSTVYFSSGRDSETEVAKQQGQPSSHAAWEPGIGDRAEEFYDVQEGHSALPIHGPIHSTQL